MIGKKTAIAVWIFCFIMGFILGHSLKEPTEKEDSGHYSHECKHGEVLNSYTKDAYLDTVGDHVFVIKDGKTINSYDLK